MLLTIGEICEFGECTPSSRNFVEGERLLNAGHVTKCGREDSVNEADDNLIRAYCLQTSGIKSSPHVIKGNISDNGKIKSMVCSCKAGLSEKCKHILGVVLHCNRNDIDNFDKLSCTDIKCSWREPQARALEKYEPAPLCTHDCYKNKFGSESAIEVPEHIQHLITEKLFANKKSALGKHMIGRHPLLLPGLNNILSDNSSEIQAIVRNPISTHLQELSNTPIPVLQRCCEIFLDRLNGDVYSICKDTENLVSVRKKERQFRITGSRCYDIYTYTKNRNPKWQEKATKYFYPKAFTNKYVKHGIENEPNALIAYEHTKQVKIVKCGLIVCKENPWLGYSPDGIIFENGVPAKLIEVKCPFDGKTMSIIDVVKNQKWLSMTENENVVLKSKHAYYGQVQLGMAMLNVQVTDFVIYPSFDNGIFIIPVAFDSDFVKQMLISLKKAYFSHMIHTVCLVEHLGDGNM